MRFGTVSGYALCITFVGFLVVGDRFARPAAAQEEAKAARPAKPTLPPHWGKLKFTDAQKKKIAKLQKDANRELAEIQDAIKLLRDQGRDAVAATVAQAKKREAEIKAQIAQLELELKKQQEILKAQTKTVQSAAEERLARLDAQRLQIQQRLVDDLVSLLTERQLETLAKLDAEAKQKEAEKRRAAEQRLK